MKIGVFDSGIGGLIILKEIVKQLPDYDYIYLADTARVPYGGRNQETIYLFTEQATTWLFEQGCQLIIIACNTSSAQALRKIQQCYLPGPMASRKILGVIIPTAETISNFPNQKIGILATEATVKSETYPKEIKKLLPDAKIYQQAAPLLVPLIESGHLEEAAETAIEYIQPLVEQNITTLILGCTHYDLLKDKLRKDLPAEIRVISQDELISAKLGTYLNRHPEIETKLEKNAKKEFYVTKLTPEIEKQAKAWFGPEINLRLANIAGFTK